MEISADPEARGKDFSYLHSPVATTTVVYRSLNGTAPYYLAADPRRLSDMPSIMRSCICDLPPIIVACDTLSRFRRELNFYVDSHIPLFCFSFLRGPCGF